MSSPEARRLLREVIETGEVEMGEHLMNDSLPKHSMTVPDVVNALRAGAVQEPEWENGEWRYQIHTTKFCVVVSFEDEDHICVITAWRWSKR